MRLEKRRQHNGINEDAAIQQISCRCKEKGFMLRILLCDDDARMLDKIHSKVRETMDALGEKVNVCKYTNADMVGTAALAAADLALLDVDLDTMNGISLGRQLRQSSPDIALIYISAYLEFAPEGYTVNAFRYILKRDMERMLPNCLEALFHEKTASGRKVLTIRQNRTEMELPYDSIYCLESDLRKVKCPVSRRSRAKEAKPRATRA